VAAGGAGAAGLPHFAFGRPRDCFGAVAATWSFRGRPGPAGGRSDVGRVKAVQATPNAAARASTIGQDGS
jgi:hypothetical protein